MSRHPSILIFADGASSGNPGPGGWGAILATLDGHVKELGGRQVPATNNQMELLGVIQALEAVRDLPGEVGVYTDSTYVIRGITQWIWAWRRKEWKTAEGKDVANAELWKVLFRLVSARRDLGKISWHYVRGHQGVPGNERVDEIAVRFSRGERVALYNGPLLKYEVAIHDLPEDTSLPEPRPRQGEGGVARKSKPVSYLSLVGNTPMRHQTWARCEARVKGRSGAKFKKAENVSQESDILKSWGYRLDDVLDEEDR